MKMLIPFICFLTMTSLAHASELPTIQDLLKTSDILAKRTPAKTAKKNAVLSKEAVEKHIKEQLSRGPGHACQLVYLNETKPDTYTGYVEFAAGPRMEIEATVVDGEIKYILGAVIASGDSSAVVKQVDETNVPAEVNTPDSTTADNPGEKADTSGKTTGEYNIDSMERSKQKLEAFSTKAEVAEAASKDVNASYGGCIPFNNAELPHSNVSSNANEDCNNITINPAQNPSSHARDTVSYASKLSGFLKQSTTVICWVVIGFLLFMIIFGVVQHYRGRAVFFGSYLDLGLGCIPAGLLTIGIFYLYAANEDATPWVLIVIPISGLFALVYNYAQAFRYNGHSKFLSFCIGTDRMVILYIVPLAIIYLYIFGHTHRRKEDSDLSYEVRRIETRLKVFAIIGLLGYFLHSLVRRNDNLGGKSGPKVNANDYTAPDLEDEQDFYCAPNLGSENRKPQSQFSQVELDRLRGMLTTPDVRPCEFDVTVEAWLYRISLWGKVNISYENSQTGEIRKRVKKQELLDALYDENMINSRGTWTIEKKNVNIVQFLRCTDPNRRKYFERFSVEVELKPELRDSN